MERPPKRPMPPRARQVLKAFAGVSLLGLVLTLWAFWFEPAYLGLEVHSLERGALPPMRVAVLADIHVGAPHKGLDELEEIISRTNEAKPDLILLAGDYVIQGVVGGTFVSPEDAAPVLGKLRAPLGVFAVLGNHDWWLDGTRVRTALEGVGIGFLEDAAIRLESENGAFWLVGVSDFWEGAHDVTEALNGLTDDGPVLLFTHNPDVFPEIPNRVELTVAGHTHGGQVCFPLIGPPIVPSKYGKRYASGLVVEEGRRLFVSTGIGTSILPVRFLVPPEVTILELVD